ncbi:hypothetical protein CEY12_06215 [Chryseobacterium sp. T16E-39]|uniref:tape measure protein n=1 Tax=Chryseobacterium sp. T16E-39 TaxID=2015076 RepID=UPI000B5B39E2|nr:tape measure protein [Chryseobacterium sp. T16E-39]ASK29723.1 hypothetical protein CEY12_06215 [Chryseobacterium sp. T16E-39]
MNTSQGALYFGAGIDLQQWRRDINSMRRDIVGLGQTVSQESRNMDSSFKNLSVGIASYFSASALKSFVMELINVRGEFQKTEIAFTTMLGNAIEAKALMGDMVNLAAKTPFSLQDVSSGAKQLLAFQIPADQVVDTLTRLGNIAAGLSVPLARINLVYGQVKAKGKLMGDDLRQFTEAGIPMVAELAKKFGKTTSEISDMVSAGKIGFKDVQDVLFSMTNEGGMFFNLMEKQSKSLSGQVANLGDAWDQMLNKIGEANEGILSDGIQGLTYLVEHYQDVIQVISTLVAAYGTYKAVLITVNALQKAQIWIEGTLAAVRFAQGISGMTKAQLLFNAAANANPYVLLASGIAAVVAAMVYFRTANYDAKEEAEKLTAALEFQQQVSDSVAAAYKRSSANIVGAVEKEIVILKSSYSTLEMRKKAYENLTKTNKSFIGTVDAEYRATVKLSDAYTALVSRLKELAIAKGKAALLEEYSKKKAQADLDLVLKQDAYEKQRAANIKKRAENAKKENIGAGMYREFKLEEGIDYSAYNPAKAAIKTRDEINKQFNILADDVAKGINDATKKNDKELRDAWSNIGDAALDSGPKKGTQEWYEEEIKRLEDLKKKAVVGSKAWNAYRDQIEKYRDLLNPKKEKKDNKQLAEIIPEGSIEELQRRANLLQKAYDTAANGVVKLRTVDKYGNDKDKKGNPYLTGEVISSQEASDRLEKINEEIKARQYKSFQERMEEGERQWNNYYKIAEYYGKETADAQYKELFKGSQNYLQFLEKQEEALKNLSDQGIISDQQKQDLIFLQEKIRSLNGTETPLEGFKRGIDDSLKKLPSLVDQLEFLEKAEDAAFEKAGGNSKDFLEKKLYFTEQKRNILQSQQDTYSEFLKEQRTFEERKLAIEKEYDLIRDKIAKDKTTTPEQKTDLTEKANKKQAKDISNMSLELFQKTDLWVKAFGDLSKIGPKTLEKMRLQFKAFLESSAGLSLKTEDLIAYQDVYKKLGEMTASRDPFKAISISVDNYKQKRKELYDIEIKSGKGSDKYKEKLEETNQAFVNIIEVTATAANATLDVVSTIGDAFGGLSDELKQTLAEVQQLIDGIINAVAGYFSGNYGQMISGIVQVVSAMVKLLGDDKHYERNIKEWQRAVEDLKTSYDELQNSIEKTAGEAAIQMQRGLVENLTEQKRLLTQMRDEEQKKKKVDQDKITSLNGQISQVGQQIESVMDNFKKSVTSTDFKELSENLANAMIDAFGKGEDAAASFDKIVDDVMRNAVANALKIKILEPAIEEMVNKLYSSMGFGNGNSNANDAQISKYQQDIKDIEDKIKTAESASYYSPENTKYVLALKAEKQRVLDLIGALKAQMAATPVGGSFDGLTAEEREKIKAMGEDAMKKYMEALKQYQDLFGESAENAQGLKGDIKGITEKTAGELEAQFNAVRINIAAVLKIMQTNQTVANSQTVLLSQIETNTRKLHNMDKTLSEINSKTKNGLAGI